MNEFFNKKQTHQKILQTLRVTYGTTGQLFLPYQVSSAAYIVYRVMMGPKVEIAVRWFRMSRAEFAGFSGHDE